MIDKTYEQAKQETNEKYKDIFHALWVAAQAQDIPFSDFLTQIKDDIEHGRIVSIKVDDTEKLTHFSIKEAEGEEQS